MSTTVNFKQQVIGLYNTIKPYALSLTKNLIDAEDLLQDTMLRAFRYEANFRHNTNLKSWLLVIMRNIFINKYRQKNTRKQSLVDPVEQIYQINRRQSTKNQGTTSLVVEDIYKAIDTLPESYQKTILMNTQGFRYQEIADALDVPLGTVKSRIFWIRKKLAKELGDYVEEKDKKYAFSLN